ncbi:Predicted metal-dependent phosphohydrolase, HD superfamily [Streptomyces zhaozhouensis]|uniref:Predicted metal-dependent phosphohydrolase, HD superfamily n=1 Tax=Streptomyces zhaozhouensis TaxID=1300267 RepID=A0A286E551_9ACTN|nr:metal-dependent phosphohydrolase [Streptomyces zhaozhouensis]SOD66032.1 Predicted metal-dependent phosphohydrolase, HD superfamily [Streptomyces zhaozhouensis]
MATSDSDESALTRRYAALPDGGGAEVGAALLARWREPHRRYHTERHLRFVLDRLDELGGSAADPVAVELAGWFHDAVYDPRGTDNEERSARLAAAVLPDSARRDEVVRLVRLTVSHRPPAGDTNGATLCDADLAVLAGAPAAYAAYAAAVRDEYRHVDDAAFATGRAGVLRGLLAGPRLFHTAYGADHWERPARANLTAELSLLP